MNSTVEDRLAHLEQEMAELKRRLPNSSALPSRNTNWLDAVVGSFENEPEFDEILKLGQLARQADRPQDGQ
jgi:hypothetical protein